MLVHLYLPTYRNICCRPLLRLPGRIELPRSPFNPGYDEDPSNAVNFFKFAAIPGCGAADGLAIPSSVTMTVQLPAELPACEHCVLRWEWTAHQQVVDIEFYVQCADVKISSTAGPMLPSPITAISGIEHLPQDASGYRKAYNGQGPEEQFLDLIKFETDLKNLFVAT